MLLLGGVCFNLGASWLELHRVSMAGIKRVESISILGVGAEHECRGGGAGRAGLDRDGR